MLIIVLLIILNIKQNVNTYERIKDDKEIGYLKLKKILEHIKEKNFLQQIILIQFIVMLNLLLNHY